LAIVVHRSKSVKSSQTALAPEKGDLILPAKLTAKDLVSGMLLFILPGFVGVSQSHAQASSKSVSPHQVVAANTAESSSRAGTKGARNGNGSSLTNSRSDASDASAVLETYRIGVDDELMISVWREQELSMPVAVRPDGMITLPLVNDVKVVDLTPKELQALLTERLKPFVTEPQVTVSVRAIRSRKVYLVGQVPRPGAYPMSGRKTALQLIAEAGGLTLFAKPSAIYILRSENGRQARIPFNYKKAIKGGREAEVALFPGDIVVVP
jgi:polysaccharide export outer membrane protein